MKNAHSRFTQVSPFARFVSFFLDRASVSYQNPLCLGIGFIGDKIS